LPTVAAHKNRKHLVSLSDLVALGTRFKINPQPDNTIFFIKSNMDFTPQDVNFSIVLIQWLIMLLSCALLVEDPWSHG